MMQNEQIAGWEEPPEVMKNENYAQARYAEVVSQLQERQGKWAMLTPRDSVQQAKSLASNIRNGKLSSFAPPGAFEVVRQDNKIWVRYLGEPENVEPKPAPEYLKPDPATARAVRTWARATGRTVRDRGRIKASLVDEWRAATRGVKS